MNEFKVLTDHDDIFIGDRNDPIVDHYYGLRLSDFLSPEEIRSLLGKEE